MQQPSRVSEEASEVSVSAVEREAGGYKLEPCTWPEETRPRATQSKTTAHEEKSDSALGGAF